MPADTVMTAMVVNRMNGRPDVQLFPLGDVNQARLEHGPTLADAKVFVLYTCCVECGVSQDELRECADCGVQACNCEVMEDPHVTDLFWCSGCQRVCGGYCCTG